MKIQKISFEDKKILRKMANKKAKIPKHIYDEYTKDEIINMLYENNIAIIFLSLIIVKKYKKIKKIIESD